MCKEDKGADLCQSCLNRPADDCSIYLLSCILPLEWKENKASEGKASSSRSCMGQHISAILLRSSDQMPVQQLGIYACSVLKSAKHPESYCMIVILILLRMLRRIGKIMIATLHGDRCILQTCIHDSQNVRLCSKATQQPADAAHLR